MLRRLLTLLSAVSLVLCVATIVLWVRSYRAGDLPVYRESHWHGRGETPVRVEQTCALWSRAGDVMLRWDRSEAWEPGVGPGPPDPSDGFGWETDTIPLSDLPDGPIGSFDVLQVGTVDAWGPFRWASAVEASPPGVPGGGYYMASRAAQCPHWTAVAATALMPLAWAVRRGSRAWRGQRLRSVSRCLACGYDLRATPGRCPECGTVPVAGRAMA